MSLLEGQLCHAVLMSQKGSWLQVLHPVDLEIDFGSHWKVCLEFLGYVAG